MLEGKNVNLRVMEREDVDFLVECFNDVNFRGEYTPVEVQISKSEEIKRFDNPSNWAILLRGRRSSSRRRTELELGLSII